MNSRRRNGKPASCEPCRKDKVRCDHALPVCSRCKQRRTTSRCFYHPAPLTRSPKRRRDEEDASANVSGTTHSEALNSSRSRSEPLVVAAGTPSLIYSTPRVVRESPAGYLGPISSVAAFRNDSDFISNMDEEFTSDGRPDSTSTPSSYWIQKTAEVVRCLVDFSNIKNLVENYYKTTQAAVIAAPLVLRALAEIEVTVNERLSENATDEQLSRLSRDIIRNTRETFKIPPSVDGTTFHKLFTGPSLRLEIIGILCTLAGRASTFGLFDSRVRNTESQVQFPRKMLVVCDVALQICKHITPLNDLTLWLLHENLLLSSLVLGDSSSVSWARLGELATDIFELGVHRDTTSSSTALPLFILESRRRLFAAAYQLDKTIATLLGRPPRISWRHSDCRLPLDISDNTLTGDSSSLEAAYRSLGPGGWNIQKPYQKASWIRLRFIISTFREEILELSLQKPSVDRANRLREISQRCYQAWAALPDHLHYTPDCWDSKLPVGAKIMLIVSYLAYLYNEFVVQSLLVQDSADANAALLDVSSTILSTVLTLGRQRERYVDVQRDFIWIILCYGFSGAGVLIRALQTQTRTGQPMPYSGSRPALLRNLSVFISHLESMARPDQANFAFFSRASTVFGRTLDEVLEQASSAIPAPAADLDTGVDADDVDASVFFNLDEMDLLENIDFGATLDQMLC